MKKENRTDLVRLRKIIDFESAYRLLSVLEKFRLFKLTLNELDSELWSLALKCG